MWVRRALLAAALLSTAAVPPVGAQTLRAKLSSLFIFGPGQDPLFLAGSADTANSAAIQAHGNHFIPSSATQNGTVIAFITDAIGGSVSNAPIGSTSGSESFRFQGGVPVPTSTSAGPIFAERAPTLGRGHTLVGVGRSSFHFATLRGVDMSNIHLTFTHENVDFNGCSARYQDDCAKMGVPPLENDVIQLRLSLDLDVDVTSFYVTHGVTDRLDVGVVLPIVRTSLIGTSDAQIVPFGGLPAVHFFGGTPTNPVLESTRQTVGSAMGLGDAAVRAKLRLRDETNGSVAILADARFPTGSSDDLLGAGHLSMRALAIASARLGDFSPHANVGYLYRGTPRQNDAVLATLGFDERMSPWATLAADLVSELQVGDDRLQLPPPVTYDAPYHRVVDPTDVPYMRDDIVNGSLGVKLSPARRTVIVLNALVPVNRGGLRPDVTYTGALEYTF